MSPGQADSGVVLDPVVDLLKMVAGPAADLQHEIKFTGQVIAGDDVGINIDMFDELIVEPGVLHADLHQDRDVIAQLAVITDNGIGLNKS